MTKVKICGVRCKEDIQKINTVLPDYCGFVFANSKRTVDKELAKKLQEELDESVLTVGVFVREKLEKIKELCEEKIIDVVQLHGEESREYVNELRRMISCPIIYAKRFQAGIDLSDIHGIPADYILLDTFVEGAFGGTGKQIDYALIPDLNKAIFIAGGLNATNVVDVIRKVKPLCVDVSSGVETNGVKDLGKMKNFIEQVRNIK